MLKAVLARRVAETAGHRATAKERERNKGWDGVKQNITRFQKTKERMKLLPMDMSPPAVQKKLEERLVIPTPSYFRANIHPNPTLKREENEMAKVAPVKTILKLDERREP